jgi:hypothetical protein
MSDRWPGVSARGVLDGDGDALAGLCDRRGPSVVGYCECVCGPERAIEAASAAFAAFRAGAVRAIDPLSIDAEALLLGRTRASAAQRAPKPAESLVYADVPCSQIAALLAEEATGSLSAPDRDRLRSHLARCVACQATQGVQEQAERAYFHPPAEALDPISRQEIIEALRRAVTVSASNGHRPAAGGRPATPAPPPAASPVIQASVASAKPRVPQPLPRTVPVAGSALTSTPVGQPAGPASGSSTTPAAVPRQPATPAPPPVVAEHPAGSQGPAQAGVGAQAGPVDYAEQDTPPSGMPAAAWDSPTGAMSAVELNAALGYGQPDAGGHAGGQGWPDGGAEAPSGQPGRRRGAAAPFASAGAGRLGVARVLGPVAVLVVGLLIALFVAGVFGGGSHHASTNPLSGAQTDPSTAVPSTSGAGAATGGGSSTASGGSASTGASASAATAASKRAAEKREQELARRLAAGTTTTATKPAKTTKTTTAATGTGTPGAGNTQAPSKPQTKPPATQTTKPPATVSKPSTTKPSGGSTVHELGTGSGSAPPVTGVPATGVTGYQPG